MLMIPQSFSHLVVFKAVLSSDHFTPATGKTIAITISKNGGAFANPAAGATNATEIASGWYSVLLGTGDTGTVGPLIIRGAVATIDDVGETRQVMAAASGLINVNAQLAGGTAVETATSLAAAQMNLANGVATGITPGRAQRIMLAAIAGKVAIAGSTVTIRDVLDAVNAIVATTDATGQRTAVNISGLT